uniref:Uncharacterized protein n=1 Tax=viral metagenome TaxID=1070528 RepID=A0A6C0KZA7_9ZZZZ
MSKDIDVLLTKVTLPDTRIASLTQDERTELFDYWRNPNPKYNAFRTALDSSYDEEGKKPSKIFNKNDGIYKGVTDNNPKAVSCFVTRILTPAIKEANTKGKLESYIKQESKKSQKVNSSLIVQPVVAEIDENACPLDENEDIIEVEREPQIDSNELENLNDFMENMLQQINKSGDDKTSAIIPTLLFVVMYIIELGIDSLELLELIKDTERGSFSTDTFKNKFKTIAKIILRTLGKLITAIQKLWEFPGGKILFFIILFCIYNTPYGYFFINSFLLAFKSIISYCTGTDIDSYFEQMREKLEAFSVTVKDVVTNFFTGLLTSVFKSAFKDWINQWATNTAEQFKEEIVEQVAEKISNSVQQLTEQIVSHSGEVVGAITNAAAEQTGEIVGAIKDSATEHTGALIESTITLGRQILNGQGQQALMVLGPMAAIPVAKILEDTLNTLNGASNIGEIADGLTYSNELLQGILRDSHYTIFDAINAGKELTPEQIDSLVDKIVDKLQQNQEDKSLITNTLNGIQQMLTQGAAATLMAAPAIQDLLNVGPRRIANYGGKKTRKNKKSNNPKKIKKTKKNKKKTKKTKKGKKSKKSKKTKKSKK